MNILDLLNAEDPFAKVSFSAKFGEFKHGDTVLSMPIDIAVDFSNTKIGYVWYKPQYGEMFQLYSSIRDGLEQKASGPDPVMTEEGKLEYPKAALRFSVYNEQSIGKPKEMTVHQKYVRHAFAELIFEYEQSVEAQTFMVPIITIKKIVDDPTGLNRVPVMSIKSFMERDAFDALGVKPAGTLPPATPQTAESPDDFASDAA